MDRDQGKDAARRQDVVGIEPRHTVARSRPAAVVPSVPGWWSPPRACTPPRRGNAPLGRAAPLCGLAPSGRTASSHLRWPAAPPRRRARRPIVDGRSARSRSSTHAGTAVPAAGYDESLPRGETAPLVRCPGAPNPATCTSRLSSCALLPMRRCALPLATIRAGVLRAERLLPHGNRTTSFASSSSGSTLSCRRRMRVLGARAARTPPRTGPRPRTASPVRVLAPSPPTRRARRRARTGSS